MRVDASAPTRIDLAGGTLDIWPLYLFHEHSQTLNVAISLRASCTLTSRTDRRIVIQSEDTGRTVDVGSRHELLHCRGLELPCLLLHHFGVDGVTLVTRSESPMGAGIAGSSALNIAICGALARWKNITLDEATLFTSAMNVEAQAIRVPTGAQDYRPAYYGGISAVELGVAGVRRVALPIDAAELEDRLVLAYTMASRNSGINNWEIMKRHIDGDEDVIERFARIRDVAVAMREALEGRRWDEVGRLVDAEWENRKRLAPGVTTPAIDRMLREAKEVGALGGKVCGAGGGGCLFCVAPPDRVPAVREALARNGARLLDFHIETKGLVVEAPAAVTP